MEFPYSKMEFIAAGGSRKENATEFTPASDLAYKIDVSAGNVGGGCRPAGWSCCLGPVVPLPHSSCRAVAHPLRAGWPAAQPPSNPANRSTAASVPTCRS